MGAGAPGWGRLPAGAEPRASVAGGGLGTGLRRGQGGAGRVQGVQGSQLTLEVHDVLRVELAGWGSWLVQGVLVQVGPLLGRFAGLTPGTGPGQVEGGGHPQHYDGKCNQKCNVHT